MNTVYVDTSALAAVVFAERNSPGVRRRLLATNQLISSNLLEAELRAAVKREGQERGRELSEVLSWIEWVLPTRPLSAEYEVVLAEGLLKGADLWHLACALHVRQAVPQLVFLSLDRRQLKVAKRLGFAVSS